MICTKNRKSSSFTLSVFLLAASAVIVKMIGVAYKIPLVRLLGAEGMGYFNAAYDVYAMLCMLCTTGLPVAVSVIMNQYTEHRKQIFRLSLWSFGILGLIGAFAVFFASEQIADAIGAPNAAMSLRFVAPAVLFISLSGAFRGYYQGQRNMTPTAISQVIEAAGKLLFGLIFAYIAISLGQNESIASGYAILGLSVGTLLCLIYLVLCDKHKEKSVTASIGYAKLLKELFKVAFPVTMAAVLAGLSKLIDLALLMRRLQDTGMEQGMAVSLYGSYSAMVIPLFNAIPAMFGAIAMPLVPHLGHAIHRNDQEKQTEILNTTFRFCAVLSIPCALGMGMLSNQILSLLFGNSVDLQTTQPLLLIISMAIPASCLIGATSAILQAYGRAWTSMLSTAIGCVCKAVSLYIFAGNAQVGVMAAPVSTLVCCLVTVGLNLFFICTVTPAFSFSGPWIKALALSAVSVGVAALTNRMAISAISNNVINVAITVAVAVVIYALLAYKVGLVRLTDIVSNKEKE